MAGVGRPPKDPDKRARGNRAPEVTEIVSDGKLYGPPLPRLGFNMMQKVRGEKGWISVPANATWPEQTKRWWNTWRRSPQAKTHTETDWDFLLETAVLHAQFWLGDNSVAAELRLRVAKFGATPEDRQRLRIRVTEAKPDAASPVEPSKPEPSTKGARSAYGHLRVVGEEEQAS